MEQPNSLKYHAFTKGDNNNLNLPTSAHVQFKVHYFIARDRQSANINYLTDVVGLLVGITLKYV